MKGISIRGPGSGEIQPIDERHERFWVGTVPSHGIPEALRSRTPEYVFASWPAGRFEVVLHIGGGIQRLSVPSPNAQSSGACATRLVKIVAT